MCDSGHAYVNGVNIIDNPVIGYCPQFDALALDLTGRETLELIANLNGLSKAKARTNKVLFIINMEKHADKLVQYYRLYCYKFGN